MPGTLVQDSLAPNVISGATLNAAGATNGTVVQVDKPGSVSFVLDLPTVASTSNSATLDVVLKGSNDSTFAAGVVTYGQFEVTGTDAVQTALADRRICADVYHKYVRASVTLGGTAPVYPGLTCYIRQEYARFTTASSA